MGLLSRPQFQVLLAASVSPDGLVAINENLSSGNAAMTLSSLARMNLINMITQADGSRWVVLTDEGRKRVRNGERLRSKASITKAKQRVTGGSFGRLGPIPSCSLDYGKPRRRPRGKLATVTALLERECGATVAELVAATGWLASSVHGTLSSRFGPRWGLPLKKLKTPDGMIYWLLHRPADVAAARAQQATAPSQSEPEGGELNP